MSALHRRAARPAAGWFRASLAAPVPRLLAGLALLLIPGCAGAGGGSAGMTGTVTRVLFLGNSYTSVNDLPGMFARLAASAHRSVETGMLADPGATLGGHLSSPATAEALRSRRWDVVVLQEQSEAPATSGLRESDVYPAARRLVGLVRAAGARPVFFLTWAHRDGLKEQGLVDYRTMQSALDQGYAAIASELHAGVAPVGAAWSTVLDSEAAPGLWQDDGSHPTVAGTYLAACVFYASIFAQRATGLEHPAGLGDEQAYRLAQTASDVVLGDPRRWGLG